jgi:DNA replication protein DnaC
MSKTAGGAATASGMDYQHRATAWVAVQILAEKEASPPWGLPATTTLDWFRSETEQPVDDLLVVTSADGIIFSQIKHRLSLSKNQGSDLASALDQCVRQFIACQSYSYGKRPWERPLEPGRDRLVVMTGPNSPASIRMYLPAVLNRLQGPAQSQSLDEVLRKEQERRALSVVRDHIERSWHATLGTLPTDSEVQQLLRLLRIQVLDVDHGGTSEREAKDLLRRAILRRHRPDQADAAWGQLIALCTRLAADRSGADRPGLRRTLLDAGFEVQAAYSYREDIERLKAHSQTTVHFLTNLARIRVGTVDVKLQRRSTDELRHAADEGSLLVVGEPGAGKSGTLHDLAQTLLDQGQDVVFLAVDRLSAQSLGELRGELGLDRNPTDILTNWPGMNPAFLIIVALDAARAELAARAIRELIQIVVEQRGRWRVVASIRKFDLRYNQELRQLFLGEPPTPFHDIEFSGIRHLNVPQLSDEEFDEVRTQSPALKNLIDNAPEELRELLRVPFNLRIMAELLGAGLGLADLTPIRTQLGLLDRYWRERVIRDEQGDARETVLRRACEEMVKDRTLRVDRSRVVDAFLSVQLHDLLSTQVLTEWQPSPAGVPDRYVLTFSHHVLFDYAVARLLLRGSPNVPVTRLTDDPELVIVIRPSLLLHFRHLWTVDPSRTLFWQLVSQIIRSDKIPEIGKLIGPAVGAEMAGVLPDLEPLCTALENTDTTSRSVAEQALGHLVGALLAGPADKRIFIGSDAGPWCELLERVSRQLRANVAYTVRSLLSVICNHPKVFTTEQQLNAGKTARRLLAVLPKELRALIHRRAQEKSVSSQRWSTFIRNHAKGILACDFCVAVTATFRILYVFVVIEHASS